MPSFGPFPVSRLKYKREVYRTAGGFDAVRHVASGDEEHGKVWIEIELEQLAAMLGVRALANRRGVADLAGGRIKARVEQVRTVKKGEI